MSASNRPIPKPSPESQHFWDGTRKGVLTIQECRDCGNRYFPPRPFCPGCQSDDVAELVASGKATLHSYVISHRPSPGFEPPFSIAVVQLEEGPRMMTNIVDVEQTPEALVLDMPLEVTFVNLADDIALPLFRPSGECS